MLTITDKLISLMNNKDLKKMLNYLINNPYGDYKVEELIDTVMVLGC